MEGITNGDIEVLASYANEQNESYDSRVPAPNKRLMKALENFGRERLSENFFMRDFMYSEISAAHGIPNVPSNPNLAIQAGQGLCKELLEPLREIFGHIAIRSAFRSSVVNRYGCEHEMNCAQNKKNYGKHIWDVLGEDDIMGATACIVIPRFIDSDWYKRTRDWTALAWFIHDQGDEKLPYSEMCFYPKNAAFNLTWRKKHRKREIRSYAKPKGILTRRGDENHDGDHREHYSEILDLLGLYS